MPDPLLGASAPLAPPIYPSAVYHLPDLDALDRVYDGSVPGFVYARDGHPNSARLAEKLAAKERARWAVVCSSGMGALATGCLTVLEAGDRVVASDQLYGRTNQLLRAELARFGVTTEFIDVGDLARVREALRSPAKLLVVETISNPLLRVSDVPALAEIAHAAGCRLLVDNTFASPVLFRPLDHGADFVMESLTKTIGGHSDVTLGLLAGTDEALRARAAQAASVWGQAPSPHDCWLAERSLPTLELRLKAATANATALAHHLREHPAVAHVIYPGLPGHPDYNLARRLLPDGCGTMLGLVLRDGTRPAVNRFMHAVPFCPSLGDVATTCSHPATTSHRFEDPAANARQGITDGLIRLSVGIEPLEEIRAKLDAGLGTRET
jgi:cystathionine gamma-synthase